MKSVIFAVLLLTQTQALAAIDCATAPIKYRKASKTYSNEISKQWACAAANQVPFEQRDTSKVVQACEQESVLYKQVKGDPKELCLRLDNPDGSQDFLLEVLKPAGNFEPEYQATRVPSTEEQGNDEIDNPFRNTPIQQPSLRCASGVSDGLEIVLSHSLEKIWLASEGANVGMPVKTERYLVARCPGCFYVAGDWAGSKLAITTRKTPFNAPTTFTGTMTGTNSKGEVETVELKGSCKEISK